MKTKVKLCIIGSGRAGMIHAMNFRHRRHRLPAFDLSFFTSVFVVCCHLLFIAYINYCFLSIIFFDFRKNAWFCVQVMDGRIGIRHTSQSAGIVLQFDPKRTEVFLCESARYKNSFEHPLPLGRGEG